MHNASDHYKIEHIFFPFFCFNIKTTLFLPPQNFTKPELPLEGIFFALNFLPWEFLFVKKLETEKTKTTKYTTFKTDRKKRS